MDLKNSMILANMMSQKEEIMYATIKGSLTESPEGVFSGFSLGSYLLTQQEIGNKPFELFTKINLTNTNLLSPIFIGASNPSLTFHIEGSKLKMQIGNGTSWVSSIYTGVTTLYANTDYYVKLVFDGIKFIGYLSSDSANWNKEVEWVNTISVLPTYYLKIGNDRLSSVYYLRGSIDLNNSYIKLGSTKYNLQAVVGYTVVGSPTIVDGVVSGFSGANYLKLDNVPQKIEFVFKFTTSSNITSRQVVISSERLIEISVWDNYIKTWNFQSRQTVSLFSIQANTTYWGKEKITSTTKTFSISIDGINYGNDITIDDNSGTGTNTIRFGTHIGNLGYNFLGSIDMNENWIKKDGKLWFNGQQA